VYTVQPPSQYSTVSFLGGVGLEDHDWDSMIDIECCYPVVEPQDVTGQLRCSAISVYTCLGLLDFVGEAYHQSLTQSTLLTNRGSIAYCSVLAKAIGSLL
jgi:hypothetical protein